MLIRPGEGTYSIACAVMEDMIDVLQGNQDSLADAAAYIRATRALASLGLMRDMTFAASGQAAVDAVHFNTSNEALLQETIRKADLLREFDMIATGVGFDGESAFTGLVIVNPDEESAEFNAAQLVERLRTVPVSTRSNETPADQLQRIEIGRDGNLVLARFYYQDPNRTLFGFPLLFNNTIILHDGPSTLTDPPATSVPATASG